jgi:hypothetical protein
MSYTVTWHPDAEDELADLWMRSADRHAVNVAARRPDQILINDPLSVGESRRGVSRIAFEDPLGIIFDVFEDDRLVTVLHVWSLD